MVLKEFLANSDSYVSFIGQYSYVTRIENLGKAIEIAQGNLASDWREDIDTHISQLIGLTQEYERNHGFPFDQNELFKLLDIQEGLGISNLLALGSYIKDNVMVAGPKIALIQQKLATAQNNLIQVLEDFRTLNIKASVDFYNRPENKAVVKVVFPDSAAGLDIEDVGKQIAEFGKNLKLLGSIDTDARAAGYKVLSASKSSPLSVEILTWSGVAVAVFHAVNAALICGERIQKIRQAQEEIKKLQIKNEDADKINEILEGSQSDANDPIKTAKEKILEQASEGNYDHENAPKAVEKGIKYIQNLVVNGGQVTVYLQPQNVETLKKPQDYLEIKKTEAIASNSYTEGKRIERGDNRSE